MFETSDRPIIRVPRPNCRGDRCWDCHFTRLEVNGMLAVKEHLQESRQGQGLNETSLDETMMAQKALMRCLPGWK